MKKFKQTLHIVQVLSMNGNETNKLLSYYNIKLLHLYINLEQNLFLITIHHILCIRYIIIILIT